MSAAEVIAGITALSPTERVQVVQQSLDQLNPELLKLVERKLRRLLHPDVPEEIWEGYEDAEDGRFVDMDMILNEEPPKQ